MMTVGVGIGLAFVAMLCWGFGDFLIQKSTRKLGDWETLFVITCFGTLVLLPFVWQKIPALISGLANSGLIILVGSGLVLLCAALLHFEGFKRGKLAVLEPLLSFELIAASLLSFFVLQDRITWPQLVMVLILMISLVLVSFREKRISKQFLLEKGTLLFFFGAILMGVADFLLGWGARVTDPIVANFVINVVMMLVTGIVIILQGKIQRLVRDIRMAPALVLVMSITDNIAWIAYTVAMTLVPIAIATGLSESSIIVAVLLGLFINKEKLQPHQKIGLIGAIIAAIILAAMTGA